MKIAICLSGKINSIEKLEIFNNSFDYFIHTWNFNSELSDNLIKIINPKKFLIEDISIYNSRKSQLNNRSIKLKNNNKNISIVCGSYVEDYECLLSDDASKIYSSMRCANLKRDYEIENNIEYDLCVRMEFNKINLLKNINFPNDIKSNTIYSINNRYVDNHFPYYSIDYDYFYCDSQTFDKISILYNFLHTLPKHGFIKNININEMFEFFRQMLLLKNEEIKL